MTSVELIGPQGYEYQYVVTALIGLLKLKNTKNLTLVIEKTGGEDAELTLLENGEVKTVEIQVKSTSSDLNLKQFTGWLAHFEDHKANANLLLRLENDQNRYALFVTRARCTDEMRSFCTMKEIVYHERNPILATNINDFLSYLGSIYTGKLSELKEQRGEFCRQQAERLRANKSNLKELTQRVNIWEQLNVDELETVIYSLLNREYLIPQSHTQTVLLYILEAIRESRNRRSDVIPLIKEILKKNAADRIFLNEVNVLREETNSLIEQLETNNVLLLTGVSYCGKTHTAEYIATHFQNRGFHGKQVQEISAASRFLISDDNEDKLCILEDPFGHSGLEDNAPDKMERITKLINKLRPNRKLIITTRKDLLTQFFGSDDINQWKMDYFDWVDLSVEDKEWMIKVWEEYAAFKGHPKDIINLVKEGIEQSNNDQVLQPGQLRHLAFKESSELEGRSFRELYSLANEDARRISTFFGRQSTDFLKVVLSLGCGASTITPISYDEIKYILSNSSKKLSMWEEDEDIFGFDEGDSFPNYTELRELNEAELQALDLLESRGFIKFDFNTYRFTHPTYLEAAKQTVQFMRTGVRQRSLLGLLEQGLFCLHPKTAAMFSKNIETIFPAFQNSPNVQKELVDLSYLAGTKSIFPVVRDMAVTFLIKIIDQLDEQKQKSVVRAIKKNKPDILKLEWEGDIPWSSRRMGFDLYEFLKRDTDNRINTDEMIKYLEKIRNEESLLTREAWLLANNFHCQFSDSDNIKLLKYLITFDEAFIREKAAYLILKVYGGYYPDVWPLVFLDSHPNVLFEAIKGSFHIWYKADYSTKARLLKHLTNIMEDTFVAAVSNDFIIHFSEYIEHKENGWKELTHAQKADLWNLWASLFHPFFKNIPDKIVQIHESRLLNTIRKSTEFLCPEHIVILVQSWLSWVEKYLQFSLPQEFGMALGEILISGTKSKPEIRESISSKLLSHRDTNFLFTILNDYIDGWAHLTHREKEEIIQLLQSDDRIDGRWLKALALTRTNVPEEIEEAILEDSQVLLKDPKEIIQVTPEDLLTDCLHVYSGFPQPLFWLGTHGAHGTVWKQVILALLDNEDHKAFGLSLKIFIGRVTDQDFLQTDEHTVFTIWKEICQSTRKETKDSAFHYLLKYSISKVGVYSKELWNIFFQSLKAEEERERYVDGILKVAEALTYYEELTYIFPEDIVNTKIITKLPTDYMSWGLLVDDQREVQDKLLLFQQMLKEEETSPRLFITYDYISNYFRKTNLLNDNLEELITIARNRLMEKSDSQKDAFDDHFELPNWYSLRREHEKV